MHRIILSALLIFTAILYPMTEAYAGRFGGSRAFHSMRSNSAFSRTYHAKQAPHANTIKQKNPSKWRHALSGLLMGGLLASLFMGHGFGSMLMSWMLLGLAVVIILRI